MNRVHSIVLPIAFAAACLASLWVAAGAERLVVSTEVDALAIQSGSAGVVTDGGHSLQPFTYRKTGSPDEIRIDHTVTNEGSSAEAFSVEVVVLDAGVGSKISSPLGWSRSTGPIPPHATWDSAPGFSNSEHIAFYVSFASDPGMVPNGGSIAGLVYYVLESRLKDGAGSIIARRRLEWHFTGAMTLGGTGAYYTQDPSPAHFIVEFKSGEREPAPPPGARSGAIQDALAPEACTACACPPGSAKLEAGSMDIRISLGPEEFGGASEDLELHVETPDPLFDHYAPGALTPVFAEGYARVKNASTGAVVQFAGPVALANVVDPDPGDQRYDLEFFHRDPGAAANPDGTYPVTGAPHTTITIENPDATGMTSNQLRFTRVFGAETEVSEFSYDAASDAWALTSESGARVESMQRTGLGDTDSDGFGEYKTTHVVENGAATAYSTVETTFEEYPFGDRRIKQVVDPAGRALTTEWEWYDDNVADGANYARLKSELHPGGNWRRHEYSALGRTKTVSQFLDAAPGAAENASRVTETIHNPAGTIPKPSTLSVERVLGQEIARRYRLDYAGGYDEIVCTSAGAAWDDPGNLVTEVRVHASGPFEDEPVRVKNPDGTLALYAYAVGPSGDKSTTAKVGAPNPAQDDIVDGTATVTITNREGYAIATTVTGIPSGLVIEESLATVIDAFGRPTTVSFPLDGTSEITVYGCCGVESRTDRRGITTTYTETGATRTETRLGITLTTTAQTVESGPNAGGLLRTVTRTGSDASVIVLSETESNAAGETIRTRDARGQDTFYGETIDSGSGHTVRTTTFPDGGTRLETAYPDGSLFTVGGTAQYPRRYDYGVDAGGAFTKEIFLDGIGGESEWEKSYTDFAGRTAKTVRPLPGGGGGVAEAESFYNGLGQLARTVDPDGVTTLYAYDARGRRNVAAIDMDGDGLIDFDGTDRIAKTDGVVALRGAEVVERTTETVWTTEGNGAATATLSLTDRAVDGLDAWVDVGGLVTHTRTVYGAPGAWTETVNHPDGSRRVRIFTNGRLASDTFEDALGAPVVATSYTYDAHGRLHTVTDARAADGDPLTTTDATRFTYYDDDQVETVTTPVPNATDPAQVTGFTYDAMGRRDIVKLPDHTPGSPKLVDYDYFETGDLERVSGARTYTVDYTYTAQGRLETLATAGGTTTWSYGAETGLLTRRILPDATDIDYTHTPAGRVETRTSARGIVTAYGYNDAGQLETIDYSDATPDVTYDYNRLGQRDAVVRAGSTHAIDWNEYGQFLEETITGGILDGVAVDPGYDGLRRRDRITAKAGAATILQGFSYDEASRLKTAGQGQHLATYAYEPDSALVSGIDYRSAGALRGGVTREHDFLNRLEAIASVSTGGVQALNRSFVYTHNAANQRSRVDLEDGSYWEYGYDLFGHLDDARRRDAAATAYPGRQFTYAYDAIGNRQESGTGFQPVERTATYTPKFGDLTQYDTITSAAFVSVTGRADAAAGVTVNGAAAARQGDYFSHELAVDNGGGAVAQSVTIEAVLGLDTDAVTRTELVPAALVTWQYDLDGNLTGDGYRTFTWDGENRLTAVETIAAAVPAGADEYRVLFDYDHLGRRIRVQVYGKPAGPGGGWELARERKFIYDGWNCVAEFEGEEKLVRSYLWGLDLDGQSGGAPFGQGAGGVGGLLCVTAHQGAEKGTHFVAYDGNGNVIALIDAATGNASAQYEYDPFGNAIAATGPMAGENPFRFSTKYAEEVTGLYDYGLRHYDARTGRWLSRDPIGEEGGVNLYAFVGNDAMNSFDVLGLVGSTVDYATRAGSGDAVAFVHYDDGQFPQTTVISDRSGGFYAFASLPDGSGGTFNHWMRVDDFEAIRTGRIWEELQAYIARKNDTDEKVIERLFGAADRARCPFWKDQEAIREVVDGLKRAKDAGVSLALATGMVIIPGPEELVVGAAVSRYSRVVAPRSVVNLGQFGDEFQELLSQIRKADFGTERNGAVFWSGFHEGNQTAAMAWAKANGKRTIEMTPGGQWLNNLDLYNNGNLSRLEVDNLWRAASAQFARGASGKVNAFTRP